MHALKQQPRPLLHQAPQALTGTPISCAKYGARARDTAACARTYSMMSVVTTIQADSSPMVTAM